MKEHSRWFYFLYLKQIFCQLHTPCIDEVCHIISYVRCFVAVQLLVAAGLCSYYHSTWDAPLLRYVLLLMQPYSARLLLLLLSLLILFIMLHAAKKGLIIRTMGIVLRSASTYSKTLWKYTYDIRWFSWKCLVFYNDTAAGIFRCFNRKSVVGRVRARIWCVSYEQYVLRCCRRSACCRKVVCVLTTC